MIEQREIIIALEMFKEHSFSEKINVFFDLCDDDDAGLIDEEKLIKFFKKNLKSEDERKVMRGAVKGLCREITVKKKISK